MAPSGLRRSATTVPMQVIAVLCSEASKCHKRVALWPVAGPAPLLYT